MPVIGQMGPMANADPTVQAIQLSNKIPTSQGILSIRTMILRNAAAQILFSLAYSIAVEIKQNQGEAALSMSVLGGNQVFFNGFSKEIKAPFSD